MAERKRLHSNVVMYGASEDCGEAFTTDRGSMWLQDDPRLPAHSRASILQRFDKQLQVLFQRQSTQRNQRRLADTNLARLQKWNDQVSVIRLTRFPETTEGGLQRTLVGSTNGIPIKVAQVDRFLFR